MDTPTDPARDDDETPLDPATEARIRALLADARHDEPAPEAVVARLDRVLAGLAAESSDAPGPAYPPPAEVTALAARRRRRVTSLLVAAAAVIAVGIGAGQVIGVRGADSDTSAGSAADSGVTSDDGGEAARGEVESAPEATASTLTGEEPTDGAAETDAGATVLPAQAPQQVSPDRFTRDVRQVLRFTTRRLAATALEGDSALEPDASASASGGVPEGTDAGGNRAGVFAAGFDCKPAAWGAGVIVPVMYDGEPAVLAFRPPTGETRVAELLRCGSGDLLRSVTLAVR